MEKTLENNNQIVLLANDNYAKNVEINENMNKEIMSISSNLNKIKINPPNKVNVSFSGDPFFSEIDKKIFELNAIKSVNEKDISKSKEEIEKLEKKKKEHIETFRNLGSEKKVWLDQLNEDDLRDLTYNSSLSKKPEHDYEYKILLLIFEGIFLEKVQENIDKALSIRGKNIGWGIMNEEEEEARKQHDEYLLKQRLEALSQLEREHEEEKHRREEENRTIEIDKQKSIVKEEWKRLFKKFWTPKDLLKAEENRKNKIKEDFSNTEPNYDLYVTVTKEVIFDHFKALCFNAWHFKNLFLCKDEYILLDTLKKYFLNLSDKHVPSDKEEELVLGIILNIVNHLKDESEILTVSEKERFSVLNRAKEKEISITESIKEVKEVRISNKEKALKRVDVSNLNSVFLPSLLTVRVLLFITIANKRIRFYSDSVENVKHLLILAQKR